MSGKRKHRIRALMAETGLKYTQAAREVDRRWEAEHPTDGDPYQRYADAHLICPECQHVYPVPEALLPQYAAIIEQREVPESPPGVDGSCPRCHPAGSADLQEHGLMMVNGGE